MRNTFRVLLIAALLLLTACGGGGGSGSQQPAAPQRTDLLYGYFGSVDNPAAGPWPPGLPGMLTSIEETGASVNLLMTGGWSGNDAASRIATMQKAVRHMQQARSFGIQKFVVSVDFLLFSFDGISPVYRGRDSALTDLAYFIGLIRNAGLLPDVVMLYPMDEPNIQVIKQDAIRAALMDLRSWMKAQPDMQGVGLFSIYAPIRYGTANVDLFDWVGIDDYDEGANVFAQFDALRQQLQPGQKLVVVPGGSDPWHADPEPFVNYANTHRDVVMVMPFTWFDAPERKGIRSNSVRDTYITLGCRLRYSGPCPGQ